MNKKGFTLTELIAVIVLLGVIALVAVPIVNETISKSKEKAHKEQINRIVSAAKRWGVDNFSLLPMENESFVLELDKLVQDGYLEDDILIDPKDDKDLTEKGYCIIITLVSDENSDFKYEYNFTNLCS